MGFDDLGMLVLAFAAIVGVTALAIRLSRGTYDRLRERVARVLATFDEVARTTGLTLRRLEGDPHPVVGSVPAFPRLAGTYRGFPVRVEIESQSAAESGATCVTRLVVQRPTLGRWPSVGGLPCSFETRVYDLGGRTFGGALRVAVDP